jgi:CheY-like chemotaxis protein
MKYLIIDDTPEHLRLLAQALRGAGYQVVFARDLGIAWQWLIRGDRFDLIAIDLALDRYAQEFAKEQQIIKKGLASRGLGDLPMSGQALGLRLWAERQKRKLRYCYITHHVHLWLAGLGDGDAAEFGGKPPSELDKVVLDKSSLWPNNVAGKFQTAYEAWNQWLT